MEEYVDVDRVAQNRILGHNSSFGVAQDSTSTFDTFFPLTCAALGEGKFALECASPQAGFSLSPIFATLDPGGTAWTTLVPPAPQTAIPPTSVARADVASLDGADGGANQATGRMTAMPSAHEQLDNGGETGSLLFTASSIAHILPHVCSPSCNHDLDLDACFDQLKEDFPLTAAVLGSSPQPLQDTTQGTLSAVGEPIIISTDEPLGVPAGISSTTTWLHAGSQLAPFQPMPTPTALAPAPAAMDVSVLQLPLPPVDELLATPTSPPTPPLADLLPALKSSGQPTDSAALAAAVLKLQQLVAHVSAGVTITVPSLAAFRLGAASQATLELVMRAAVWINMQSDLTTPNATNLLRQCGNVMFAVCPCTFRSGDKGKLVPALIRALCAKAGVPQHKADMIVTNYGKERNAHNVRRKRERDRAAAAATTTADTAAADTTTADTAAADAAAVFAAANTASAVGAMEQDPHDTGGEAVHDTGGRKRPASPSGGPRAKKAP